MGEYNFLKVFEFTDDMWHTYFTVNLKKNTDLVGAVPCIDRYSELRFRSQRKEVYHKSIVVALPLDFLS